MIQNKHQQYAPNSLVIYRRRMKFTQKHVADLLGHRRTLMLSRYEQGRSLPPLPTALRLGIILRVPVEFLFSALYKELREDVRTREA